MTPSRGVVEWSGSAAGVCRIFPGSRRSTRQRAKAATTPYSRSAALSRTAPPSELARWRSNAATTGLSKRSGKRTVWGIVSVVKQGSPWHRRAYASRDPVKSSEPFVVGVIDSGIHAGHPHIGAVAAGANFAGEGNIDDDTVDRLGHGTAVAAAIQDLVPAVHVCPLKVFDRALDTSVEALVAAIDWAAAHALPLVNLSLGTSDGSRAARLADAVGRAHEAGVVIVAAGSDRGVDWLPGTLDLDGVIRVELDWAYPRGSHTVAGSPAAPVLRTCGYPRPIPGVDPERNLKGLSFAVANVTGIAAQAMLETGLGDYEAVLIELRRGAR